MDRNSPVWHYHWFW